MKSSSEQDSSLYNSRIIDTCIKLIKSKYSHIDVGELLSHAGMKEYETADQGHWFSGEQIDRFYEKLVQLTGNPGIAREAGRYAASPDALGVMRQCALGLIDPANAFALINKVSLNFTRSSVYTSRKLSVNSVEITVTRREEGIERPFQCDNRIGHFEALVLMFNNKLPDIRHPECLAKGGKQCRYIITWEKPRSVVVTRLRNRTTLLLLAVNVALMSLNQWETVKGIFPLSVVTVFLLSLAVTRIEKRELRKSLDSTKDSIDGLLEQININYNNALMTNEIGKALSTYTNTDDILANIVQILEKRLDYDRGLVLLADKERTKLELQAAFGYSDSEQEQLNRLSFRLNRSESKGIFVLSFWEQKPYLINDLNDIEGALSPRSLAFAKKMGTHSFICCPIVREDAAIGVLAVDNMKSKKPLVQSDMSLLMGIASVIAVSIRNAELIDARMRQFNSILQVLAASIDARDSLTAGHSEKVTEYALGICNELGLPGDYREMIRVASLLHDYGKLGIPDAILKKDGRLTDDEYETVKTHSDKTREILAQINFEGIYREVPEIAGAHHEKVDGTGYPKGLKGEEIPFGARIIAVADYFEAITAKRHYRDPMDVATAFVLLREGRGRHFESRLVDAFISYYSRTHQDMKSNRTSPDREQRRVRVQYRAPVFLRVNGSTSAAMCEDISARGIYLATDCEVKEGVAVDLSITLPDSSSTIVEAKGRVAWVNSKKQWKKPEFPTGFGVELLEFKEAAGEIFTAFMSNYISTACVQGNNYFPAGQGSPWVFQSAS